MTRSNRDLPDLVDLLVQSHPAPAACIGRDARVRTANENFARRFSTTTQEIVGRPLCGILGEERWRRAEPQLRAALEGETVRLDLEDDMPSSATGLIASCDPYRDASGEVAGALMILRSAEERRLEELNKQLQQQVLDFQVLFEFLPVGITALTAEEGRTRLSLNRHFAMMAGVESGPDVPAANEAPYVILKDGVALPFQELPMRRALRDGTATSGEELQIRRADGTTLDLIGNAAPIFSADGSVRRVFGAFVDITERNRALSEARKSHALFRRLFEADVVGTMIGSFDGRILEANDFVLRLLGYSREELERGELRWDTITPAEYEQADRTAIAEAKKNGKFGPYLKEFFRRDGARVPVLLGFATTDTNEAIAYVVDLTGQREIENRASAEVNYRRAIENSITSGIAVVDLSGKQTHVNRAFCEMVGWSAGELVGRKAPFPYWPQDQIDVIGRAFEQTVARGPDPAGFELWFQHRSGSRFLAHLTLAPLCDAEGEKQGWVAAVRDVTREHAAKDARLFLSEASAILARSLDIDETYRSMTRIAVPRIADWCMVDKIEEDGGFERCAISVSTASDERIAARLRRRFAPKESALGVSRSARTLQTQVVQPVADDVLLAIARDEEHLASLREMKIRAFICVPLAARGRTFGVISFIRSHNTQPFTPEDLSLAEELGRRASLAIDNARLYTEVRDANRAKDEFLATLSHELRTPLTAILGWANALQLPHTDAEVMKEGLDSIARSAHVQARLIDEVLDVSRIITGKMRIEPVVVDLAPVIRDAVEAVRSQAMQKKIELTVDIDDAIRVTGDAPRLQQIVWNLLSNAIKFTPAGGRVSVSAAAENAQAVIRVKDTGQGISPEFLPFVFDRFRQEDSSSTRKHSGLGLGLAIAQSLVRLHAGVIDAESEGAGSGSTFTVRLPLQGANDASVARAAAPDLPRLDGIRVVVVDDQDDARGFISALLRRCGAEVHAMATAPDALEAVLATEPHLVISDIAMPEHDGYWLLGKLRHASARLPILALSAFGAAEESSKIREAGFDAYLQKPVDITTLAGVVARLAARW